MRGKVFPLLAGLFSVCALQAQQFTTSIHGKVFDKDSKQPLEAVNIFILNSNPPVGTSTDENGNFRIANIGVGRHSLKFSFVGYNEVTLNEVLVTSGKETVVNVEMQEKVTTLKEVTVTQERDKSKSSNDFATVSVRSFSAEEMNRYAGTLNDPARLAQSFAGVMTANDENNQIVVRGNSPRGLLWRMEGIEIPNPNHFAAAEGATGGGVSMLSSNMLTNTDFFSGAFPAEYGNALSSVFDLNLRKGNTDKNEFALQLGVLGAEAALEGPWSKKYKGSYLINYRYSTLQLFQLMHFDLGGSVTPKYQDLSFNFYFPAGKAGSFTVFGLGGLSELGNAAKRDTAKWNTFDDKTDWLHKQWMGIAGITHLLLLKDNRTYLKTSVAYSYNNNSETDDSLSNSFEKFQLQQDKFIYRTLRAHTYLNSKLNSKNSIRAGVIYSNINYQLASAQYSFFLHKTQTLVNDNGNTNMIQAYVQWKHRFTERLSVNSGVHFSYSFLNDKFYIEPRLSGEWVAGQNQILSLGAGIHSRMDAVSTYVSYRSQSAFPNKKLDFTRAFHWVAGYHIGFKKDFRFKTEAYFQYLFSVPVGADTVHKTFSILNYDEGFVSYPLVSTGVGYNYGLEVTLEKFFSHNYFFTFTASVFDSKYKAPDGKWRSTAYDVNYVMNVLGGKEFVVGKKKNNIIGINAKIIWRGGQRYTPVDSALSAASFETVYDNERAYSKKLPDYFRIDFGASFRRNKKRYSWVFSFDAQNIINRKNIAAQIYNTETGKVEFKRNLGIVPVFSWKVYFSVGRRKN